MPKINEFAKGTASSSGTGGTSDYSALTNKPRINGTELLGNKNSVDLNLQTRLEAGNNITLVGGQLSGQPVTIDVTGVVFGVNSSTPNITIDTTIPGCPIIGVYDTAMEVSYSNTTSGLMATDVQTAIDELAVGVPQQGNCVALLPPEHTTGKPAKYLSTFLDVVVLFDTADMQVVSGVLGMGCLVVDTVGAVGTIVSREGSQWGVQTNTTTVASYGYLPVADLSKTIGQSVQIDKAQVDNLSGEFSIGIIVSDADGTIAVVVEGITAGTFLAKTIAVSSADPLPTDHQNDVGALAADSFLDDSGFGASRIFAPEKFSMLSGTLEKGAIVVDDAGSTGIVSGPIKDGFAATTTAVPFTRESTVYKMLGSLKDAVNLAGGSISFDTSLVPVFSAEQSDIVVNFYNTSTAAIPVASITIARDSQLLPNEDPNSAITIVWTNITTAKTTKVYGLDDTATTRQWLMATIDIPSDFVGTDVGTGCWVVPKIMNYAGNSVTNFCTVVLSPSNSPRAYLDDIAQTYMSNKYARTGVVVNLETVQAGDILDGSTLVFNTQPENGGPDLDQVKPEFLTITFANGYTIQADFNLMIPGNPSITNFGLYDAAGAAVTTFGTYEYLDITNNCKFHWNMARFEMPKNVTMVVTSNDHGMAGSADYQGNISVLFVGHKAEAQRIHVVDMNWILQHGLFNGRPISMAVQAWQMRPKTNFNLQNARVNFFAKFTRGNQDVGDDKRIEFAEKGTPRTGYILYRKDTKDLGMYIDIGMPDGTVTSILKANVWQRTDFGFAWPRPLIVTRNDLTNTSYGAPDLFIGAVSGFNSLLSFSMEGDMLANLATQMR
jgi:hypothetical protein